jgi:hypothetical protein
LRQEKFNNGAADDEWQNRAKQDVIVITTLSELLLKA